MRLVALSDHTLAVLFVQVAALLVAARALGRLARWVGQPPVLGELLAGLLLGPSVFGEIWPRGFNWFLPGHGVQGNSGLSVVAEISLVVLLVVIGSETDLKLIRQLGRAAGLVSLFSVALPFAAGVAVAYGLPKELMGPHGSRETFGLLMAGAVTVSSLPVIAKIIGDMGMGRRNFGQLIFAAGTVNDTFGFLVVAVVTAMVGASGTSSTDHLLRVVLGLVVAVVLVVTVGQRVLDWQLRSVLAGGSRLTGGLAVTITGAFIVTAMFQALGVEGALGAFLFGLIVSRSRFVPEETGSGVAALSSAVFAPLYFATAGLRVDIPSLTRPALYSLAGLVAVALVAKLIGAALGAALARLPRREWLALGVGLNGRGALQVILGSAGLSVGVLSNAAYSDVILMSLITSLLTPPLLRWVVRGWRGTSDEQERLEFEEEMASNVVVRGQRLLIPSRGSPNSIVAAEVLAAAWPEGSDVTILSIRDEGDGAPPDLDAAAAVLEPRQVERRHVDSEDVLEEILAEARLGYGVIGVGAAETPGPEGLLSPVIDDLLVRSPIPLVVVRRARQLSRPTPPAFSVALVPVAGSEASRAAQEVAYNLSRRLGTRVNLVHVITRPGSGGRSRSAAGAGEGVLADAGAHARDMGVDVLTWRRYGQAAGDEILTATRELSADVVILGATVRLVEDRPFLGHTVEHVLEHADVTVVVVVLPDRTRAGDARAVSAEAETG